MEVWRVLGTLALLLTTVGTSRAQSYALVEPSRVGDCLRVHLEMKLSGEIRLNQRGKIVPIRLEASAEHEYPERILSVGRQGLPDKAVRFYEKAHAEIATNNDSTERGLRPERRLFVAQRYKDQLLVYAPAGAITRDEQQLTGEHFDSLCVTGILPTKEVTIGDSWKIANAEVQALCGFEGLTEQDLNAKLESVADQKAHIAITGTATGIDVGALVRLTIEASAEFDLATQRITSLHWKQINNRDQGPASPASTTQTNIVLTRAALEVPKNLSDVALVTVPEGFEPPLAMTSLEFRDPKSRFIMNYGREWQTVSRTDEHLVLRLMERGDFVAQATLSPWTKAEKGKHLSGEEFQEAMDATPGWQPEKVLQTGEVPAEGGRWMYRISALGKLDGSEVMQNFYLIASPEGEQLVIAFTMTPKQAERLGTRDLALAGSIELIDK
jgi:hypothetical protein